MDVYAWIKLGVAYKRMGEKDKARECFKKAVELPLSEDSPALDREAKQEAYEYLRELGE